MSSENSVTEWLEQLKHGDSLAAQKLRGRYIGQLIRVAHKKLGQAPRRAADEKDVVLAAFASFCRGAEAGRFAEFDDRDDLWQVLVMLTERKAIDQIRHESAQIRGAGQVRGDSALEAGDSAASGRLGLGQLADAAHAPEFAALVAERFEQLLGALNDLEMERIALDKMAGYTNKEITGQLDTNLRRVERKLRLIRRI